MTSLSNQNNPQKSSARLLFLDGLRGIAILMVVLFHTFSRWPNLLPYLTQYGDFFLFKFGNYGVQLFFIISGFVILMTLEKCDSFGEFIYRRWLRLFPAMLIASIIILATAPFLTARPAGQPVLLNTLPGILFIEPEFFSAIFGYVQKPLEGSFWSLFVEMKFYIVAGCFYFMLGRRKMIMILLTMFSSSILIYYISPYLSKPLLDNLYIVLHYLDYRYYGWFVTGALLYEYHITKNRLFWFASILVGFVASRYLDGFKILPMLVANSLIFIFAYSLISPALQRFLSSKFLLLMGFISYPFYLIHENAMISMIYQLHQHNGWIPNLLLPILPIFVITIVAWIIAKYLEPITRKLIKQMLSYKSVTLGQKIE